MARSMSELESDWACAGGFTIALRGAAATIASSANAARAVPHRRRSPEPSLMLQGRFCANGTGQSSRSPGFQPFPADCLTLPACPALPALPALDHPCGLNRKPTHGPVTKYLGFDGDGK